MYWVPSICYPKGVQVPNNHILSQNLYYNSHHPKPKDLIIGYLDALGYVFQIKWPHNGSERDDQHGVEGFGRENTAK